MAGVAGALAAVSSAAYSNTLAGLPAGFTPLNAPGLQNGTFASGNAFGAAVTATFGTQKVVVVAFRGSDDRADWINNIRDINADYAKLAPLTAAAETYAAQNGAVVVATGHSLGGALAQVYLADRPAAANASTFAVTFGAPGALLPDRFDSRVVNYEIAADPIPYLGEYRIEIGDRARADGVYTESVSQSLSAFAGSGLTAGDVRNSVPFLTADYVNSGAAVTLPASNGSQSFIPVSRFLSTTGFPDLLVTQGFEHARQNYIAQSANAAIPDPTFLPFSGEQLNPAYRFFDRLTGDHFYTTGSLESSFVRANYGQFNFERVAWATPDKGPGTTDVFRFFDTVTGSHHYTTDPAERAFIKANLPTFADEGIGFQAFAQNTGDPDLLTLTRFYNTQSKVHHFSASPSETASLRAAASAGWVEEGPGFTVHRPIAEMLLI